MPRGFFITLEGLDGSGKTTQVKRLADWMREQGHDPLLTRQPGGTATGDRIRELLLDSRSAGIAPMAEMALMFADRAQAIAEVIEPALAAGRIVLCDRWTDSTEAYQGGGRKLGSKAVLELHRILCGDLQPDLTIVLDSDPAKSLGRARNRNRIVADRANKSSGKHDDENRFEQENRAFFARVREGYMTIAKREPDRVVVIDASGTPAETQRKVAATVGSKLGLGADQSHEPR